MRMSSDALRASPEIFSMLSSSGSTNLRFSTRSTMSCMYPDSAGCSDARTLMRFPSSPSSSTIRGTAACISGTSSAMRMSAECRISRESSGPLTNLENRSVGLYLPATVTSIPVSTRPNVFAQSSNDATPRRSSSSGCR